jgi:glycine/D-amino acid oxidase-like deaminating enzyme
MPDFDCDVLVIGAGLAGLRCAAVLTARGRDVWVWEAAGEVGGRVGTDVIDGFRCDRGFQVLNPAYPELARAVDVSALDLQPFGAGIAVRRERGAAVWVHPLREPRRIPAMLAGGGIGLRDLMAAARWAAPALQPRRVKRNRHRDVALRDGLDRAGVRGELRRVVDRFLAGVVLDDTGATSNGFALLLARMFLVGVPALPADGMRALPAQLAAGLDGRISLQRKVTAVEKASEGWLVRDGRGAARARQVVVATDPLAAAELTGRRPPAMRGVVTDWWSTDQAPPGPPMLWVDGRAGASGPVLNTAVISAAAPSYAAPGRHLVAASALVGPHGEPPDETATRAHAGEILGVDPSRWTPVTRQVIRAALPAQLPPLSVRRPVRTPDGLWLCGDHRDTASIQGALVSGRRAAEQIAAAR